MEETMRTDGAFSNKKGEVTLRCADGVQRLSLSDILYLESSGHRCIIHEAAGEHHLYDKLDNLEKYLADGNFLRIHQSYLVNMNCIKNISGYSASLKNGISLPVPKARYRKVRTRFDEYMAKGE